jgi:DNA-binding CsgD family transcriptional regulator
MVMQTDGVQAGIALLDEELTSLAGESRLIVEAEQAWMISLHPPSAMRSQPLIDAYAGLPGDTPGQRAMLAMVGLAMSLDGRRPAHVVTPIVARAFGDGALLADQRHDSSAHSIASYALLITEQFELAEREMSRAADAARRTGSTALGIVLVVRGMARLNLGRLADAEADGLATLEFGRAFPGSLNDFVAAAATGIVVDARAERGDDDGATAALVDNGLIGDLGSDPQLRALLPRARAHLAAGRAEAALADAKRAQVGYRDHQDVMNHCEIVESQAHLALGDRAAAFETGSAQLRRARAWGTPAVLATALRITALAIGGPDGIALLLEAEHALDDSPALLEKARCLLALGMLHRRVGTRTAALDALRRGGDLAHGLGARRIAELARAEMRVLGARPRRLAFSGAESLTASQRRVAQLAARGRTNREIASELYLSLKTVEAHLRETYNKLGISSRRELATIIAARDPERHHTTAT